MAIGNNNATEKKLWAAADQLRANSQLSSQEYSVPVLGLHTNQGFITCISNEKFPLYTLYYWLHENVEKFISLGTGATFKEIIKGVFKKIEIIVPPKKLLTEFEKTVAPINQQVLIFQRNNINLRKTRDLLLPKLISGKIDVEGLDI